MRGAFYPIYFCLYLCCMAIGVAHAAWQTVFEDNFDSLSTKDWNISDNGRDYAQFLPANVSIRSGKFVITTKVQTSGTYAYTSGGIESQHKHAFHPNNYGGKIRIEASAKMPKGKGIWPAFWTLSDAGGWPPEVDIFETLGLFPQRLYMTYHWGNSSATHQQSSTHWDGTFDYSLAYHNYAVVWTPDSIMWEIDGVQRAKYADAASIGQLTAQYLILYTQMGGWDGNWPITDNTFLPAETSFDWVRVSRWSDAMTTLPYRAKSGSPGPNSDYGLLYPTVMWRWWNPNGAEFDLSGRSPPFGK